jgi:hypothetical protein
VTLPVADAPIVVAGIARDVRERLRARDAAAAFADDDGQLALIVEALGLRGRIIGWPPPTWLLAKRVKIMGCCGVGWPLSARCVA